jgi:hypothetical protein
MISEEEKLNRRKSVQFALDNNRLAGYKPPENFIALSEKWIEGDLTIEEFKIELYNRLGLGDYLNKKLGD